MLFYLYPNMNISYKTSSLNVEKLQGSNFAKFLHQALNTLDFIEGTLFIFISFVKDSHFI